MLAGECESGCYCDAAASEHRWHCNGDLVVVITVRTAANVVGSTGTNAMRIARETADKLDTQLMMHIESKPPALPDILDLLRSGDVLTHRFTGFDNRVVDQHGEPAREGVAARERGVLFDVGHGVSAFSADVAFAMMSPVSCRTRLARTYINIAAARSLTCPRYCPSFWHPAWTLRRYWGWLPWRRRQSFNCRSLAVCEWAPRLTRDV